MPSATMTSSLIVAGLSMSSSLSKTTDGAITQEVSLVAGMAGTLTTKASDTAGTVTVTATPTMSNSDTVNLFWSGGSAYGATVGTISSMAIPFTGASGDSMPDQDTVITIAKVTNINLDVVGNDIDLNSANCTVAGHLNYKTAEPADIAQVTLYANKAYLWEDKNGVTNPLAGETVGSVDASVQGTAVGTLKLGILYDSTP